MAAFVKAYEMGADGIELDIHKTQDGVLIVMHDENVARTTMGRGYIHSAPYSWIRTLDAGSRFHRRFAGEKVPSLDEVFSFIKSTRMRINVEMKNQQIHYPRLEEDLLTLIAHHGLEERVVISSFNHDSIRRVRTLDAGIDTALLCTDFRPVDALYAQQFRASAIHPSYKSVSPDYVSDATRRGIQMRPYTVDEDHVMRALHAWGVTGLITNRPDIARSVVG